MNTEGRAIEYDAAPENDEGQDEERAKEERRDL